jgi:hypothetical protein
MPANIRVNIGAPFPAAVKSTVGVGIARKNGTWSIGLAYPQMGIQTPPVTNYGNDFVAVYDSVAQTYFLVPLTLVGGSVAQRSITSAPAALLPTDQILHLNLTAAGTITLPSFSSRNGVPLIFKDVGMKATANPQTLAAAAGETIDGFASVVLGVNGQSIRLVPANDGVNAGWFRE